MASAPTTSLLFLLVWLAAPAVVRAALDPHGFVWKANVIEATLGRQDPNDTSAHCRPPDGYELRTTRKGFPSYFKTAAANREYERAVESRGARVTGRGSIASIRTQEELEIVWEYGGESQSILRSDFFKGNQIL